MTVPIELAKKAARYEKLMNEANTLFEELEEWRMKTAMKIFMLMDSERLSWQKGKNSLTENIVTKP